MARAAPAPAQVPHQFARTELPGGDAVGMVHLIHQSAKFRCRYRHDIADVMRKAESRLAAILRRREHSPREQGQAVGILV